MVITLKSIEYLYIILIYSFIKSLGIKLVHFIHLLHYVRIFYFRFFLRYLRYVLVFLYRVLEAGEKHNTGDENSLIFGMGGIIISRLFGSEKDMQKIVYSCEKTIAFREFHIAFS